MPVIKPGIKLPKTDSQWKAANDYFHAMLPMSMIDPKNIGDSVFKMFEVLYIYFKNTYGIVDTTSGDMEGQIQANAEERFKIMLMHLKVESSPI